MDNYYKACQLAFFSLLPGKLDKKELNNELDNKGNKKVMCKKQFQQKEEIK